MTIRDRPDGTLTPITVRPAEPRDAEAVAGLLGEFGHPATREAVLDRLQRRLEPASPPEVDDQPDR